MSCVYWILHPPDGPLLTNVIQSLLVNFFLPTFKCLYFYFLLLLSYLFSFFSKDGLFWSAAAAPKTQLIRIYLKFCERDAKGRTQDWSTATNAEMKTKNFFFVQKKEVFGLWNQFRRRHIKVKSNLGFLPHIKRSRRKKISWTQFFGLEIKRHWCLRIGQLEIIGSSVVLQTKWQGFEFRKRETVAHFCIADVHKAQF